MVDAPYGIGSGLPTDNTSQVGAPFVDGPVKAPAPTVQPMQELALEFRGSSREYFKIWIVNLCLTLLTLGIFSAWAKVRKKRYLYAHTTLDGTPFQYLAQPVPILKGRLIAAAGFMVYYLSRNVFTFLLPWVLGVALIAAPWVIARSSAFRARYSAFRNMTFHFDAGYLATVKALYAWGLIPAVAVGIIFSWTWTGEPWILGISSLIFGIAFPFWLCRLKKFIVEHMQFGGRSGVFSATGGQFFGIYFTAGLIMTGLTIPLGVFAFMLATGRHDGIWFMSYIVPLWSYANYAVSYAFIRSRSINLTWNKTQVGPLRFKASMKARDLVGLYLTNALGIIASAGLLIPWAVMRTLKYRIDHLQVVQKGLLAEFKGSDTDTVSALGSETMDFLDLDLSL
jgi:uncharacterized membrane protein YjgN (DUF898 family)